MMTTASELYDRMVTVIDQARAAENIYDVPRAAEREGMTGGEVEAGLSQRWEYKFADANGGTVSVECYWYDTSKAYSIRPDRHVMKVSMEADGDERSYTQLYES